MKVLITGANGFLGSHIARQAIHEMGWDVRLLILPGTREDVLDEMVRGGERIYGDILDYESLLDAARGVDIVFHTAGSILEWAKPNQILIGETTFKQLGNNFPTKDIGYIEVKSIEHPIRVYELVWKEIKSDE